MSLTTRLARRFMRDAPILRTAGAAALVASFVLGANAYLDAQTLDEEQWVESQIADYQLRYSPQVDVPFGSPAGLTLSDEIERSAPGATSALLSIDLPIATLADDGVTYIEADWTTQLSDSYAIDQGSWPSAPGEVLIVGDVVDSVEVGEELLALGRTPLTVVGTGQDRFFEREALVLASPGTWGSFDAPSDARLAGVAASLRVYLPDSNASGQALRSIDAVLRAHDLQPRSLSPDAAAVESRSDLAREAPESWLGRSPLLFWIPSLTVVPLAVAVTVMAQFRRIVPAARNMHAQGASRFTAITAPWLPLFLIAAMGAAMGAVGGFAAAAAAADLLAGRLAAPSPSIGLPVAGVGAVLGGLLLGGAMSWLTFAGRALPRQNTSASIGPDRGRSRTRREPLRRALVLLTTCAIAYRALTVDDGWSSLQLVCLSVVAAVLVAPETSALVSRLLPAGRLSGVLSRRLIGTYRFRAATYLAVLIAGFGVTMGVVTTVNSAVAAERAQQIAVAPPGLLALDNDDAPSLPVPDVVKQAAEEVPSLAQQRPVQMWSTGRLRSKDMQLVEYATTGEGAGVVFSVETAADLERLFQRSLTRSERAVLDSGGMVVITPDVRIVGGEVALRSSDTAVEYGSVPAVVANLDHGAPWYTFVPGYMLRGTAVELGMPLTAGALIYTDVSLADSERVLTALTEAGINPEQAEVHHDVPPVVAEPALAGISVLLIALSTGVAILLTRSQVSGMRVWIYGLARVGVQTRWTRGVLVRQNLALTLGGIAAGSIAALLPVAWGAAVVPALVVDVPWTILGITALLTVLTCTGVTWLSLRRVISLDPGLYSRAE